MRTYDKPVFTAAALCAVCILLSIACLNMQFGEANQYRYHVFTVKFEHFGIDAAEMEKTITIPLEEKLGAISGIFEIRSAAEYGISTTSVYFEKNIDEKKIYLELREITDTLYAALPQSVQKPHIYSSDTNRQPVYAFSLSSDTTDLHTVRRFADTSLKPLLESIDGVAEVIVSGGSTDEIQILFDIERMASGGINPEMLGTVVKDANVVSPGGTIRNPRENRILVFNSRIKTVDEMRQLPVTLKDNIIRFMHIADIGKNPREKNEIVRIRNTESIAVSVKAAGNGNSMLISKQCAKRLKPVIPEDIVFTVLYDNGKQISDMIGHIALAVLQSFLLVILVLPLFFHSPRNLSVIIFTLPFSVFTALAFLSKSQQSIDQNVLSGISIALGLVIDAPVVVAESEAASGTKNIFFIKMSEIIPSMLSSTLTTLLVLIPLWFFEYLVPGIRNVISTIAMMLISSLIFSVVFLPVFIYRKNRFKQNSQTVLSSFFHRVHTFYIKTSYKITLYAIKKDKLLSVVYILLIFLPFALLIFSGKNINTESNDVIMPVYIEFEPEQSASSIDMQTRNFINSIENITAVEYARTEAKKGSLEVEIKFDAKQTTKEQLAQKINSYAYLLHNGFLYIPDLSEEKHTHTLHEIQIGITGDDIDTCRTLAQSAAKIIGGNYGIEQVVLNFKNKEKAVYFIPDRNLLERNDTDIQSVANILRWMLFGPVIDKWFQNNSETDIRIAGKKTGNMTVAAVKNLHIPTGKNEIPLHTLGTILQTQFTGKLYRKDGRPVSYITIHIHAKSSDKAVTAIQTYLNEISLPKGYAFSLPKELIHLKKNYRILTLVFISSIIAIIILLTALTENPLHALLIASIIPVSVSLPLLIRFICTTPLTMGDIIGMVIISGISVNNAIYIMESNHTSLLFKIRNKIQSILVTSITSILGALPLWIMGQTGFSKSLGFVLFFGTTASLAASLLLYPAVLQTYKKHRR